MTTPSDCSTEGQRRWRKLKAFAIACLIGLLATIVILYGIGAIIGAACLYAAVCYSIGGYFGGCLLFLCPIVFVTVTWILYYCIYDEMRLPNG
jgi:hypothetical protein